MDHVRPCLMKARRLSFLEAPFLCLTCTVSLFRWLLLVHYTMPRHVCKYYEETAILWRFLLSATETFIISRKIARYPAVDLLFFLNDECCCFFVFFCRKVIAFRLEDWTQTYFETDDVSRERHVISALPESQGQETLVLLICNTMSNYLLRCKESTRRNGCAQLQWAQTGWSPVSSSLIWCQMLRQRVKVVTCTIPPPPNAHYKMLWACGGCVSCTR